MEYKIHRFLAWLGRIPRNPFNKTRVYTPAYIGSWPVDVAKAIAKSLRKRGYHIRLRGRKPKQGYEYTYFGDLPLKCANLAAVYLMNIQRYVCEDCGYEQGKRKTSSTTSRTGRKIKRRSPRSIYLVAGKILCYKCTQKINVKDIKKTYLTS